MVAKIGRGNNLFGALTYNQLKVENENGKILFMNKMIETKDGRYTVAQLAKSFEPYLMANQNTEKATLHISLNPDPKDRVSDEKFVQIAQDYMNEMGYGEQPFVVFKHTDISRTHIHLVSVGVDEDGRKISDKFEKRKSMKICRDIEKKYQLLIATDKKFRQNELVFNPVDYQSGNVKSQLASVIKNISKYYHFQTIGEYNALLSLFNINSEKVEKVEDGVSKNGLVYFVLNEKGDKISHPFKSSLFGKIAGLDALNDHFLKSKERLKGSSFDKILKATLVLIMKNQPSELKFKEKLKEMGISTIVRRNATGRIYGVTFIDHQSRSVWNGSRLGKEFSANAFDEYWSANINSNKQRNDESRNDVYLNNFEVVQSEQPHELFNFLQDHSTNIIEEFGSILPESLGEDFDELDFENKIKKKRKLRKPKS